MDFHHSSGWGVMIEVEMDQRTYVLLSMVRMDWIGIRTVVGVGEQWYSFRCIR